MYRGDLPAERDFIDLAVKVILPATAAGPIERSIKPLASV